MLDKVFENLCILLNDCVVQKAVSRQKLLRTQSYKRLSDCNRKFLEARKM